MNVRDRRLLPRTLSCCVGSPRHTFARLLQRQREKKKKKSFIGFAIVSAAQTLHLHSIPALLPAKSLLLFVLILVFAFALHFAFPLATGSSEPPQFRQRESTAPKTAAQQKTKKSRSTQRKAFPHPATRSATSASIAAFFATFSPEQGSHRQPAAHLKKSACPPASKSASCNPRGPSIIHCKLATPEAYHRRQPQLRPRHWRNTSSGDSAHLQRPFPNCPSIQSERCIALSHWLLLISSFWEYLPTSPVAATANHSQGHAHSLWLRRIGT